MTSLEYVGGKEASRILGVHQRTLYIWEDKKTYRYNKNTRW